MSNSTAICYYDDAEKLAELAEIARSMGITISLPNPDEPTHSERIKQVWKELSARERSWEGKPM